MVEQQKANTLSGLAKKLVQANLLDSATALQALDSAAKKKIPFVAYLVEKDIINENINIISISSKIIE